MGIVQTPMHIKHTSDNGQCTTQYSCKEITSFEDITVYLGETGWEDVNWTHRAQERDQRLGLVNAVTNLQVP